MRNYLPHKLTFLLFLCLSIFPWNHVDAQNQVLIDSLQKVVATSPSDSIKIRTLFQLFGLYEKQNPSIAIKYVQQSLALAEKTNRVQDLVIANRTLGTLLFRQGKIDQGLTFITKALKLSEKKGIDDEIPRCLNNIGLIHTVRGDWTEAMKCFNRGLIILEKAEGKDALIVEFLNNIGVVLSERKKFTQAKVYYERVLKMTKEIGDSIGISIALTNIGEMLYELGEKRKALDSYKDALVISIKIDDIYGVGYLYTNMGIAYFDEGKIEIAEDYLVQATEIADRINALDEKIRIYNTLAKIEQSKENYFEANQYCQKGLTIAQNMRSKVHIKNMYELMAQNYELQENYPEALRYHQLFKTVNDTLFNQGKSRQIEELAIQYETQKREAENQILKEEKAKNEALLERRTILNWTIFLFLILVSVIAYSLYINSQRKQKYYATLEKEVEERTQALKNSNAKLKRSNTDLEQFAYITSHDLKEPLRNIASFTSLIARNLGNKIDSETKEDIDFVQKNVRQMDALIEGVLSYARIKKVEDITEEIDLNEVINKLKDVLKNTIEEKNVQVTAHHLPTLKVNAAQIFIVFKNLVENAIKYNTRKTPTIEISSKRVKQYYHIQVKDNGIGIKKDYQDKIFTMFQRLHSRNTYDGVGIGLSVCRKIIQHTGGEIWVESEEGKGSRFIFSIPIDAI